MSSTSKWKAAVAALSFCLIIAVSMLARAESRLGRFDGRWIAVEGDLSRPAWPELLPGGSYDAIVSALAIHHLEAPDKRRLFASILELLEPGAMFLNMDYVAVSGPLEGLFEEQMAINLVRAERERGSTRSEQEITRELSVAFDADEEDHPDPAEQQVQWLAEAGFEGDRKSVV